MLRQLLERRKLSQGPPQENRQEAVTFLILFFLGFLPYVNTLFNNFVYDDNIQLVKNPYVHSFQYLKQIFTTTVWSFQGAQGNSNYYRPVMSLTYLLTYKVAGAMPFSFHLLNLALNGLAVWLVYYLLRRFSGERVALIAAGLFALHPVHTESVAWIAGVTDLELTVFYLATFLLYLRLPDARDKGFARAEMCLAFAMALLSKEQAMTLPVLIMVFEHFYREDRSTTSIGEKVSRHAPLWATVALYFGARTIVVGGFTKTVTRPDLSLYETVLSAAALVGQYLAKLLWPAHLSVYYVFHPSLHISDRTFLAGLAGIAVCAALFFILWRRAHILSFALLWMFATLAPVLNARWMPASAFGERFLYLPSVGFCWLVGWAAVKLCSVREPAWFRPFARAVPVLLGVIVLLYGMRTITRNRDWASSEILFRDVLRTHADASLIRAALGVISYGEGDLAGAERAWLQALNDEPNNTFALENMAVLRQRQQRYAESLDYSWHALRLRPVYTDAHVGLAQTLALLGREGEAEWQFRIATTLSPLSTSALNAYGKFLYDSGRVEDARAEFERSATVDPTNEAYDRLGDIYLKWQDTPRAEQSFRRAIGVEPFDAHAHIGLGEVLESVGRPGDALHEYEAGLEIDPTNPIAKAASIRISGRVPGKTAPH